MTVRPRSARLRRPCDCMIPSGGSWIASFSTSSGRKELALTNEIVRITPHAGSMDVRYQRGRGVSRARNIQWRRLGPWKVHAVSLRFLLYFGRKHSKSCSAEPCPLRVRRVHLPPSQLQPFRFKPLERSPASSFALITVSSMLLRTCSEEQLALARCSSGRCVKTRSSPLAKMSMNWSLPIYAFAEHGTISFGIAAVDVVMLPPKSSMMAD